MSKVTRNVRLKKVKVTLDKDRVLLFDLNAFIELEEKFGTVDKALQALSDGSIKALRALLWAGLLHEDENLTEKTVGALIGLGDLQEVAQAINEAVMSALPEIKENDPNLQAPPQP